MNTFTKIVFIMTVIIAGIYLCIPQDNLTKLAQYLPKNKAETNTKILLENINQSVTKRVNQDIDEKLTEFKQTLLTQKDKRIDALEKELTDLKIQLHSGDTLPNKEQQGRIVQEADSHNISAPSLEDFPTEPAFAATQYLSGKESITNNSLMQMPKEPLDEHNIKKQKVIKQQANLQDIAERMHKASLLALSH